jgi:probable phosphoglycerate mutase
MEDVELWLVRHGETTRSVRRELAGWADPPLTARGEDEAKALRQVLNGRSFTSTWSSDLTRAVTTARLAWGEPRQDPRLRELHFGSLEGRRWPDLDPDCHNRLMAFEDFAAPGGESVRQLRRRLLAFVDELDPGQHLVFTHGGTIRALCQDIGVNRFVGTGSVVAVDWSSGEVLFLHEPARVV